MEIGICKFIKQRRYGLAQEVMCYACVYVAISSTSS
jgi:hypothetical protein